MTALTTRLYDAWRQAVVAGEVINQFEAEQDGLSGQCAKGERITYGQALAFDPLAVSKTFPPRPPRVGFAAIIMPIPLACFTASRC